MTFILLQMALTEYSIGLRMSQLRLSVILALRTEIAPYSCVMELLDGKLPEMSESLMACIEELLWLFYVAVSEVTAFVGFPVHLDCGPLSSMDVDWTYHISEDAGRAIALNGVIQDNDDGKFSVDKSGIIINDVKAVDAGVYVCGHSSSTYHKINLTVSCEYYF